MQWTYLVIDRVLHGLLGQWCKSGHSEERHMEVSETCSPNQNKASEQFYIPGRMVEINDTFRPTSLVHTKTRWILEDISGQLQTRSINKMQNQRITAIVPNMVSLV